MDKITDYRTPGQLIQALLDERGWTQRVLATVLGMREPDVNKIVTDRRPITPPLAITLEEVFGVSAQIFLGLQQSFDLGKARLVARPDPGRAMRAKLFGDLPIAEMVKRGWLETDNARDVRKVESALAKFFGADSLGDIEFLPHAAKKTQVSVTATPVQLAWLYRVKMIAKELIVSPYSPHAMRSALPKLNNLLSAPEEARKVPRILSECGIRYVIVESLPGSKIDGVCFWLDSVSPVIGMSLRHDRIDNFWFVLRHEIEHVLQLHGRAAVMHMLDAELEGERAGTSADIPEEERVANKAAADFCIPSKDMDAFVSRKAPFFAERDVLGFARTLGVHPGLVAGQLQRRTDRYDRFRNHLVKIRASVAPSAMVDGWGDIYPVGA